MIRLLYNPIYKDGKLASAQKVIDVNPSQVPLWVKKGYVVAPGQECKEKAQTPKRGRPRGV